MSVRPAKLSDLDILVKYLELLFSIEKEFITQKGKIELGLIELICGYSGIVMVVEEQGEVAGMATGQIVVSTSAGGSSLLVEDVFVAEKFRGRGAGSLLLDALKSWGACKGISRMQLVADRNNQPAIEFYRKLGWKGSNLTAMYYHF